MRGRISSPAISGVITLFTVPATLKVGKEIQVKIDGDLYDYDKGWYEPWYGCFTVERAGYRNYDTFEGWGKVIGPQWAPTLGLGPMSDISVVVTVKLWAQPSAWAGTDWDWDRIAELGWVGPLDTKTKTIVPTGIPPPPEECDIPGATQCVGADLYTCTAGEWILTEANSPECPPKGFDWKWVALGSGALLAGAILFRARR